MSFFISDDLDISPDFYEYFSATFKILHEDDSLWCVSAWNDNGKGGMVSDDAGREEDIYLLNVTFKEKGYLRNHCNIFWVDGGIHSKNGGKTTSCVKRMMRKFSLRFWCRYLHKPPKNYNDSLSFYLDAFKH